MADANLNRACLVSCGLRAEECACWRANNQPLLYGAMPRQDLQVGTDTIALRRAEVEALMEAAKRGMLQADENQWSERWYFDACVSLATLQERMK